MYQTIKIFTTISDPLDQGCPVEFPIMNLKCGEHSTGCLLVGRHSTG